MKISYNWLHEYLSREVPISVITDTLTSIGLEVESVTAYESIKGGLRGVVVGHVLTCEKHPDADRLHLTTVDIGSSTPLQIVCGAQNVAAGQKVLVATVGAHLYMFNGEELTIKKGKIRGQESHGMICAEDELGIGNSHDGIMVLPVEAVPGTPAAEQLQIEFDHVLEIGLTPNRTDAFCHMGVARDLVAALSHHPEKGFADIELRTPFIPIAEFKKDHSIAITISDEAAIRYNGVLLEDIQVQDSPEWLRKKIESIGLQSINNIVDITNLVMHESGQPLHAFDADVIGNNIEIRKAKPNESLQLLDGQVIKLQENDIVIAGINGAECLAGVMGGKRSGVNTSTQRIFLESACFHPSLVRKSSRRHGIFSDSSFRFERGTDVSSVTTSMHRAIDLIKSLCPEAIVVFNKDVYPTEIPQTQVSYYPDKTRKMAGSQISDSKIAGIIKSLGCEILSQDSGKWNVRIPYYKADVLRQADLDEEILRIHGYDQISIPPQFRFTPAIEKQPSNDLVQDEIARTLCALGCNEMMSMSMMPDAWKETTGKSEQAIELSNPISGDLALMRTQLLAGAANSIGLNRRHQSPNVRGYEFGKLYHRRGTQIIEEHAIGIWVSGNKNAESWNHPSDASAGIAELRSLVDSIFSLFKIGRTQLRSTDFKGLSQCEGFYAGDLLLGVMGIASNETLLLSGCNTPFYYAELYWHALKKISPSRGTKFIPVEKFPSVRRDLSMVFQTHVRYADIESAAMKAEKKLLRSIDLFDVYEGKNLGDGLKSYALKFMLQNPERTLTDQEIDQAMQRIQASIEQIGGKLRV